MVGNLANNQNANAFIIKSIPDIALKIFDTYPQLYKSYEEHSSTKLAEMIIENNPDFRPYGVRLVAKSILYAFKHDFYENFDGYEELAWSHNSQSGKTSIIELNLKDGKTIWDGALGKRALELRKNAIENGERKWGLVVRIAEELNKEGNQVDPISLTKFYTRMRKKHPHLEYL